MATDISYVDDADPFVVAESPASLVSKAGVMMAVVDRSYAAHKLDINYAKGKTEMAIVLRGFRARRERTELSRRGGIEFITANG